MVLEGIWESAGFYLQRIVNVVDAMPVGGGYDQLRDSIYALLKLSDLICCRAGLRRYQNGNVTPERKLPACLVESIRSIRQVVVFSAEELASHGINIDHLSMFGFNPNERTSLPEQNICSSSLVRYPVAHKNGLVFLLLPTAVSPAIRSFVVESMDAAHMREAFLMGLAREYEQLLSATPILGGRMGAPTEFHKTKNGLLCSLMTRVDVGRSLSFVFFIDMLEKFNETGLAGVNPDTMSLVSEFDQRIDIFHHKANTQDDFVDGITLLVSCGIGRGNVYSTSKRTWKNWRVESISAHDLITLSWTPDFKPLSLWRLLSAQDKLNSLGVELYNINGLLNMVAWTRALDGHLVPHGDIPNDFAASGPSLVMVEQNGLRTIRHEVSAGFDVHCEINVKDEWVRVRKYNESVFDEDKKFPLYVSGEFQPEAPPTLVYCTAERTWWGHCVCDESISPPDAFERWRLLATWLPRIASTLSASLDALPLGAILLEAHFKGSARGLHPIPKSASFDEVKAGITIQYTKHNRTVVANVGAAFERALFHPENIAERAFVEAVVECLAKLAKRTLQPPEFAEIVTKIVPSEFARQTHAFQATQFRHYIGHTLPSSPILVDKADDATVRLGLGWTVRSDQDEPRITGKKFCTSFLSDLVRKMEDDLCSDLGRYNRRSVIRFALLNHETAAVDRDTWRRTSAALVALHGDKEATIREIADREFKLNAVFQATRLLVEIAVCECPSSSGSNIGKLDFSRFMAKILHIAHLGGLSDAIHWDATEPSLWITPLGDVFANYEYFDKILHPFALVGTDLTLSKAIQGYADLFDEPNIQPSSKEMLDHSFLQAWEDEFGATLDEYRAFIDTVEDFGIRLNSAVIKTTKGRLLKDAKHQPADCIMEELTLKNRKRWRQVPEGYHDRDRQPWKFRRRLSVLRKPVIELEPNGDPLLMIAPAIVRDAFAYTVSNLFHGDFPEAQIRSDSMLAWTGKAKARREEFNHEVAERMIELGWTAKHDLKLTELLKAGIDEEFGDLKRFGDIDVLAWDNASRRIVVMECKDVQYRKLPGEIAEQLSDFRGRLDSSGKPDLLLKHLNRLDVISERADSLSKFTKLPAGTPVEGYLVFRNPVPMQFAREQIQKQVAMTTYDELCQVFSR